MNLNNISGVTFTELLEYGYKNLVAHYKAINDLNVFPVPDGDTGTNMKMTIEGGAHEGLKNKDKNIGNVAKSIARGMVLSARGNSGVITSQFFKGLSLGLEGKDSVSVREFADAMISGTKKSYSVVQNPTEGTILTVMREAGDLAITHLKENTTLPEYLKIYLAEAKVSLEHTPELLEVLKKAGRKYGGGTLTTLKNKIEEF